MDEIKMKHLAEGPAISYRSDHLRDVAAVVQAERVGRGKVGRALKATIGLDHSDKMQIVMPQPAHSLADGTEFRQCDGHAERKIVQRFGGTVVFGWLAASSDDFSLLTYLNTLWCRIWTAQRR